MRGEIILIVASIVLMIICVHLRRQNRNLRDDLDVLSYLAGRVIHNEKDDTWSVERRDGWYKYFYKQNDK